MRMIGHLDSGVKARSFSDYLTMKGVENQVEAEKDGTWAVWIHSEEQLKWSKELFALYQQNPADPNFQVAAKALADLREQKRKEQETYEKRVKGRRHLFRPLSAYGFGLITFALIFFSAAVFVFGLLGKGGQLMKELSYTNYDLVNVDQLSMFRAFLGRIKDFHYMLPEIRRGEAWRVFTPIFLHFGFLHIFFNMLWLRDLGSMIEARQNSFIFLILVAAFAAGSNTAQYLVTGGQFGGMSGVVYGLVGYIWIRGKFDPGSGLFLHSSTVTMMVIWFFVCLVGIMGPIANTAHGVGLVMGMAWGFISSLRHR